MIVEYSTNIEYELRTDILLPKLCDMGVETGVFARIGIRVWGEARSRYHISDGYPDNAFVHTILRVGHGREKEMLKAAGDRIYEVICDHLASLAATRALNISMEIHPVLTWKKNNTPEWLERRADEDKDINTKTDTATDQAAEKPHERRLPVCCFTPIPRIVPFISARSRSNPSTGMIPSMP
jgi:5-carboxymethyl-2-hydroxymuconate isomerase